MASMNQKVKFNEPQQQKNKLKMNSGQLRAQSYSKAYSPTRNHLEPEMRPVKSTRPEWNDNVKREPGYFDPRAAKKFQVYSKKNERQLAEQSQNIQEQEIYREKPDKPSGQQKTTHSKSQSENKKTFVKKSDLDSQANLRRITESYNTLAQIQSMVDKENAKQNVGVMKKQDKQLQQLKELISEEEDKRAQLDDVYKEKYEQLKDQKKMNLEMQQMMLSIKQQKADMVNKKAMEYQTGHKAKNQFDRDDGEHPPAEYIEGMMWEKDAMNPGKQKNLQDQLTFGEQPKPQSKQNLKRSQAQQPQQQQSHTQQQQQQQPQHQQQQQQQKKQNVQQSFSQPHIAQNTSQNLDATDMMPTREDGTLDPSQMKNMQKKQKEFNDNMKHQLIEVQREQAKKAREIEELISLHKETMEREKSLQNQPFIHIENQLQGIKGGVDMIDSKLKQQEERDVTAGNILVKASSKMVQTYNEQITDLVLDDILAELVNRLQDLEEKEKVRMKQDKRAAVVSDYIEEFKELAHEQDEIEERLRVIQNNHKPIDFFDGIRPGGRDYVQDNTFAKYIHIELSRYVMLQIIEKRNQYTESLNKKSMYSKRNLESFKIITDEIIDDIMYEVSQEVDRANDEYSELVFQNEFQ